MFGERENVTLQAITSTMVAEELSGWPAIYEGPKLTFIELIDRTVKYGNWFKKWMVYLIRLFAASFTQGDDFVYYFKHLLYYSYSFVSFVLQTGGV